MDSILILDEMQLRRAVPLDLAAVEVTEGAFRALAGPGVVMPPVLSMALPDAHGEVDVKTAYLPGLDSFALKVSPGFFDNPRLGLPSLNGLMVVLSARTGLVDAVLLDNGYLTDIRTAAAGAVAARHLARDDLRAAGVLGAGAQARLQLHAARLVRGFPRACVWARNGAQARDFASEMSVALDLPVTVADSPAALVAACDLVITATPSRVPLITVGMLHPGLHITAMGADQAGKTEIAPEALAQAIYVCDRVSQCSALGELRGARAAGLMADDPPELGQIIAGAKPGRTAADQVTICDLTGTGAQDTAIANHALEVLRGSDIGVRIAR